MQTSLLRTKFYIPKPRPEYVPRQRLIELLNESLWQMDEGEVQEFFRKLTIISAPAGFGKTTLASAWAMGCPFPVTWVSLDEGDNDPIQFLSYLINAIQAVDRALGESALSMVQSPQPPPHEAILTDLINDLGDIGQPFALILDDYHTITNASIHEIITFLINHLPHQMHLVVVGRTDPAFSLSFLRAQGQLVEIRSGELRFTIDEAKFFLNESMGLQISTQDVAALEARTEGWIAGLQLAAVSMSKQEDVSKFVAEFTGSHRYVIDYLIGEVLEGQPVEIQEFLLKSSILDRLSAGLCDEVVFTDKASAIEIRETLSAVIHPGSETLSLSASQTILDYLESSNLFLVALDNQRQWYRYHHLFSDLLRQRLRTSQGRDIPELHQRASLWYERQEMPEEAIGHAISGDDFQRAVRLIENNGRDWMAQSKLGTLLHWLQVIPRELIHKRPNMGLYYGWAMALTNQFDAVEGVLEDAENGMRDALDQPDLLREYGLDDPLEQAVFWGYLATCRAALARSQGDTRRTIELLFQALELFPENELGGRSVAYLYLGYALWMAGDISSARLNFEQANRLSQSSGHLLTTQSAIDALGKLLLEFGELKQAARIHQQAIDLAEIYAKQSGVGSRNVGLAYNGLANLHYEWNKIETAEIYANQAVEMFEPWGVTENLLDSYNILARIKLARDDVSGALKIAQTAAELVQNPQAPDWLRAQVEAKQARHWIKLGVEGPEHLAAAKGWAAHTGLNPEQTPTYFREHEYITLARLCLARREFNDAIKLLDRLLVLAESTGRNGRLIEILLLRALALFANSEIDLALRALARGMALAEPEGFMRIFIDEGSPMFSLLQEAKSRGVFPDYIHQLLAAFSEDSISQSTPAATLPEPVSERELEVLRLMSAGQSGPQVAEQLYLSINTVKTHVKNIYRKLGVNQRFEAIQKAKDLGLI